MIKSKLVAIIGRKQDHLPERDIAHSINLIFEKMADFLAKRGRIEIRGFGSFSLHYREARQAHNPRTGSKLMTQPKYAVHYKPGKELKERVDANKHLPIKEAGGDEE